MKSEGTAFCYGNDVNTDVIFAGKYTYTVNSPEEMAKHALEDLDPEFVTRVKPGDVIVAGTNFGCGSSREQAVVCLKASGISAIIARSFARIYYRNCINQGLPALILPEAVDAIRPGDRVSVDLARGVVETANQTFTFPPYPPEIQVILEAGGIIPYIKSQLKG
ncbi:MAG TPA: 3-isopropylmalate dehydratase small subunit [Thermoanaerobaculia bacterium]|mgnify:CR=1 FL=1|nr:3-isopropylmalate dehydratase small subunit [Thermoanaerobaculia bacterium]HUM28752.1 3-isopropylmalate dehydratase small subunit [Thermoanaerobaculia bacterium]HXK67998.1 3-isopropylmalate dehydratase small subunit [Thermoanaerobaculia bacterium]